MARSNSQVAHLWANQSKAHASGSSFYFEGATIFSYGGHFPIARHVQNEKGKRAVLFTTRSYSVSTNRHMSLTRGALYGLDLPIFYVSDVSSLNKSSLREEVKNTIKLAAEHAESAKRCRKAWRIESELESARTCLKQAQDLSNFFKLGVRVPAFEKLAKLSEEFQKELAQKHEQEEEARKIQEEKARVAQELRRAKDLESFQAWQAGMFAHGCPSSFATDENGSAYLTVKRFEGEEYVQTSLGAEVPFADVKRAFRFVKLCRIKGERFDANGAKVPVGDFAIRWIDASGNVQVGCHYFTWARVEEFAKTWNFFEEAPSAEAVTH